MTILRLGIIFLLLLATSIFAHSNPQFPGTQGQQPQAHHQAHAQQAQQQHHQQPPQGQPLPQGTNQQQQHQQGQQFGGEAVKDEGHIKEHLEGKVDPTAHMTPEQLQFHYFNMHDLDKNGKLDGVELIKAITHFHEENPGSRPGGQPPPLPTETELENMIDSILKEDDFNADGFIDYGEFLRAQKAREEQARRHQEQYNQQQGQQGQGQHQQQQQQNQQQPPR